MYKRILVPLDGSQLSEKVVPFVRLLAKHLGCPVELLRVIEPVPSALADPAHGQYLDKLATGFRDTARDSLGRLSDTLEEGGLEVSTIVHEGDPASIIVNSAESAPGTLIAMSTHGRSGLSRWFLGSVTDKVLRATTSPLLIIRSKPSEVTESDAKLKRVIVPLDGSLLAEQSLPHAIGLAKALGLGVDLVRVTPSEGEYYRHMSMHPMDGAPASFYPSYAESMKQADAEASDYLQGLNESLQRQGNLSVGNCLRHGHPAGAILDLTSDTCDSLVAMTTHGRSGIGRWVLGSVADRVVKHSGGPVLLVRAKEQEDGAELTIRSRPI